LRQQPVVREGELFQTEDADAHVLVPATAMSVAMHGIAQLGTGKCLSGAPEEAATCPRSDSVQEGPIGTGCIPSIGPAPTRTDVGVMLLATT
jgi:hypothetical protein